MFLGCLFGEDWIWGTDYPEIRKRSYVDPVLKLGALLKHVPKGDMHNQFNT